MTMKKASSKQREKTKALPKNLKQASSVTMTGAQIMVRALQDQGVDTLFGYPGGAVLPIYDELYQQQKIRHILVRHEQGAVHAAEGYARSTGKVGAVLVTSGPGATNAVTGLTDAMLDSTPIVCFTGQVPTTLIGTDAFQEADTVGITRHCTKHNYLVRDVNRLAATIHEAFHVARTGRPGPVVIDLPKDVQFATGVYQPPAALRTHYRPKMTPDQGALGRAVEMLSKAERPMIYIGGGVVNAGAKACQLLTEFVHLTGFPCTSTLMGLGAFPTSDHKFLGMLGMHGTYEANMAMHGCDVMLNIGARFDDRVTGKIAGFAPKAKKIHVDIDSGSINKNVAVDVPIVGDAGAALETMLDLWRVRGYRAKPLAKWWATIDQWRERKCLAYVQNGSSIKPQFAIERLRDLTMDRDVFFTTEVGQHQMWAAQFLRLDQPHRFVTSGGLGTMGFGMPAAIGVQLAHKDSIVVDIAGDASILMNIQEFSTAVQYQLPIKIFIINNQWMGMVRQWQEMLHESRYSQTRVEAQPDFVRLAEAFGGVGMRVDSVEALDRAILDMLKIKDRPVIVDVCVDGEENCLPMIPSGKNHNEILVGEANLDISKAIVGKGKTLV